jgi:hypothetical protein
MDIISQLLSITLENYIDFLRKDRDDHVEVIIRASRPQLLQLVTRLPRAEKIKRNLSTNYYRKFFTDRIFETYRTEYVTAVGLRPHATLTPEQEAAIPSALKLLKKLSKPQLTLEERLRKIKDKMIGEDPPYYLRTETVWRAPDQSKYTTETKDTKITSHDDLNRFFTNIVNKQFTYETSNSTILDIKIKMHRNPTDPVIFLRAAKYAVENCVLNVLRHSIGDEHLAKIYKRFPHLNPDNRDIKGTSDLIYITGEEISAIFRMRDIRRKCRIFTKLSDATNGAPWIVCGDPTRGSIDIVVSNEHARCRKVGKIARVHIVSHHDQHLSQLHVASPIVCDYRIDNASGAPCACVMRTSYESSLPLPEGFEGPVDQPKLIMYKTYDTTKFAKLSPKFADPLPYAYIHSDETMLFKVFKEQFGLGIVTDDYCYKFFKSAESFIGRGIISDMPGGPGDAYPLGSQLPECYEIDQCSAYAAYEYNPYYIGFPSCDLMPVSRANSKFPVGALLKNGTSIPPPYSMFYKTSYLTYPDYKYLCDEKVLTSDDVELFIEDRKANRCGEYSKISILGWLEEMKGSYGIAQDDLKRFRNTLIGRTITGGLNETKDLQLECSKEEFDQVLYECDRDGIKFTSNESRRSIRCHIPRKRSSLFQFHSYILAYSRIGMMKKFIELTSRSSMNNIPVVGYNVDSFIIPSTIPPASIPGIMNKYSESVPGRWKSKEVSYDFIKNLSHYAIYHNTYVVTNPPDFELPPPGDAQLPPPGDAELPVLPPRSICNNIITIGAPGNGKSYLPMSQPSWNQCVLTKTKLLMRTHREKYGVGNGQASYYTFEKYFQTNLTDEAFYSLRRMGKLPPIHQHIIIDECFMFTRREMDIAMVRATADNSTLELLGDDQQLINSIDQQCPPTSLRYFTCGLNAAKIKFEVNTCQRGPKSRHDSVFGGFLDTLRYHHPTAQWNILMNASNIHKSDMDGVIHDPLVQHVLVEKWASAVNVNKARLEWCYMNNEKFPLSSHQKVQLDPNSPKLSKEHIIEYFGGDELRRASPQTYWNKSGMNDVGANVHGRKKKYLPAWATTVDSVQGNTVEYPSKIAVCKMDRHGAIYVAVTRVRRADQIIMVV